MIFSGSKPTIAIVGYGKVGSVLAKAFVVADYTLSGLVIRHRQRDAWLDSLRLPVVDKIADLPAGTDFLVLCVRDAQIEDLVMEITDRGGFHEGTVIAHTAGAVSAEPLEPVREVGALPMCWHPMQTFVGGEEPDLFNGVTFGIDGDSEAVELGERIARDLGGIPFRIPPDKRRLYHLSAVVACNLMSGLVSMAVRLLCDSGMTEAQALQTLGPLIRKTARNIAEKGLPDAISGPLKRGDEKTIKAHLEVLEDYPDMGMVYRLLSRELLDRLAKDQVDLNELKNILSLPPEKVRDLIRL